MAKQSLSLGSSANDGTGDTLRDGGDKINDNFNELYNLLGDGTTLTSELTIEDSCVVWEGNTPDAHETRLKTVDPTADRVLLLPDADGTIAATGSTNTGFSFTSPKIVTGINDTNGNEIIKVTATGSAVNELTIANGASTAGPTLSATGSATNLNLALLAKGTGSVNVDKLAFSTSFITSNGAANTSVTYIVGNKPSGGILAVSMADGTTHGEYKIFTNKGAEAMRVTPNAFAQGASFTLAQYDGCTCVWDGTNWYLVGNQGEITVTP